METNIHHLTTEEEGEDLIVKMVTAGLFMSWGLELHVLKIKPQVVYQMTH